MVNTANNKLTKIFVIAALSMGALAACKDSTSDDTSDRNPSITADSATAANGTSGYDKDKTSPGASTAAKKKGKASVATSDMSGASATGNAGGDKMTMDKEGVYNRATVMPEFPGGQEALATYVNNHVDYPQRAIDDNAAGTVRVSFVVDENGKVKNAKVVGGQQVGGGLDREALRVVNNMPAWKPGKVKGHNVKTRLELPINFQLEA